MAPYSGVFEGGLSYKSENEKANLSERPAQKLKSRLKHFKKEWNAYFVNWINIF